MHLMILLYTDFEPGQGCLISRKAIQPAALHVTILSLPF